MDDSNEIKGFENVERFLGYCRIHAGSDRALFSPYHTNKLLELSGSNHRVTAWTTIYEADMSELLERIKVNHD